MVDLFLENYYKLLQNNKREHKDLYEEKAEIKFKKEKNQSYLISGKKDNKEFFNFFADKKIATTELLCTDRISLEDNLYFHIIGLFKTDDLYYFRFSQHIVVNKNKKIILDSLVILDENVKFTHENCIFYNNSLGKDKKELIEFFKNCGEVKFIHISDNKNEVKIFFDEKSSREKAKKLITEKCSLNNKFNESKYEKNYN